MEIQRRRAPLKLPAAPLRVIATLRRAGHEAYAVGGAIRDGLRGETLKDLDVATSASPKEVAILFPRTHEVGARFGVMLVIEDDEPIEVATFRTEGGYLDGRHPERVEFADLAADAVRRDFTINALYYDPLREEILDPTGGLGDLERGVLRSIGDPSIRFGEDHLRLLRCARFAAQLGFVIEERTWQALVAHASSIATVSPERVRIELERMLTGPRPATGLRILLHSGLLRHVLPEIQAMVGVQQPPQFHPEGDVFVHTCLTLEKLERRTRPLAWAALLHDVGKPPTCRQAERIRFDRHVPVGMEMAEGILQRLHCDRETIERVVALIRDHLRFSAVEEMRPSTLKRFLRQPHFDDHLALHRADCQASHGDLGLYEYCRRKLHELSEEELRPKPLLRGHDLLAMGFSPGPLVGRILRAVEDAQLEETLKTREEALEWIAARWRPSPSEREE